MNVMSNNSTAVDDVTPETVPAVAYAGHPVVTTALLARLYGSEAKHIQNNFARNNARFEPGKHFFKVEGADLAELKNRPSLRGSVGMKAKSLIVWTERGAARHAKMLDTDQAWEVFEKLEDCYFGKSEAAKPLAALPCQTPIGQTVGTDGFNCLAAIMDGKVRHLPAAARRGAKNHIWSQVHKAFAVVSGEDIPTNQLDSARNFIGAYAIEGELLTKKAREDEFTLTHRQAEWLTTLLHSADWVSYRWGMEIEEGVKALNPQLYSRTFEHFQQLLIAASTLDKELAEMVRRYRRDELRPEEYYRSGRS